MTNDTSTLSGALLEMKDQLIYELGQKGVTATYSSSTGLLGLISKIGDIQTGGSCYHIEFDESSYTAVGGSATISCTLQSNYAPLSGATVTFTGSDSSLYTGITNSNGVATTTVSVSANTTFTCSYSNVTDTCTVNAQSYIFYDSGVTGTKNTNFDCTKSQSDYTLTTDTTGTVFVCNGGDGFYIPNIDISTYSSLQITWTFTYGTRYACHVSLLNSSKNYSSNNRWHNAGQNTPGTSWYTPSGTVTITNALTSGDEMKLIKSNNTFSLYCNDELISTATPGYTVVYIGLTSADGNRPFGYKELKIESV